MAAESAPPPRERTSWPLAAGIAIIPLFAAAAPAADFDSAAQPVYAAAENFTDGVYSFLDKPLALLLPGRLAPQWEAAPQESSYDLFERELKSRQDRADRLIEQSLPVGPVSSNGLAAWRGSVVGEERKTLTDAFAATFASRYDLKRYNPLSRDASDDSGGWDPGRLASTVLLGSAYVYAAGLRADFTAGPIKFDADVAPGSALLRSCESGRSGRLASLRVSHGDSPLALETDWGMRDGRADRESVGINYTRRF
jgi:hypothetical protein